VLLFGLALGFGRIPFYKNQAQLPYHHKRGGVGMYRQRVAWRRLTSFSPRHALPCHLPGYVDLRVRPDSAAPGRESLRRLHQQHAVSPRRTTADAVCPGGVDPSPFVRTAPRSARNAPANPSRAPGRDRRIRNIRERCPSCLPASHAPPRTHDGVFCLLLLPGSPRD